MVSKELRVSNIKVNQFKQKDPYKEKELPKNKPLIVISGKDILFRNKRPFSMISIVPSEQ